MSIRYVHWQHYNNQECSYSMRFNGVIFDFNGTLFLDSEKHELAWKRFSDEVRGYPFSDKEMEWNVHGRTNRQILTYLLNQPISDDQLHEFVVKKETLYKQYCLQDHKGMKLIDGAEEFFNFLTERHIPMTIASSSEITNLRFFNQHFGLDRWFDMKKVVYDDYKIKGKPAPDMFLAAAGNLGLSASSCLIFEDSESGIQAAKAAGAGGIVHVDATKAANNSHKNDDVLCVIPDFLAFDAQRYF